MKKKGQYITSLSIVEADDELADAAHLLDDLENNARSRLFEVVQHEVDTENKEHVNTPNTESTSSITTTHTSTAISTTPTINIDINIADTNNTDTNIESNNPATPNIVLSNVESTLETSTDNVQQLAELIASISNEDIPSSQKDVTIGIIYDFIFLKKRKGGKKKASEIPCYKNNNYCEM